ncbi:MAG: FAD-binding and (Fe-S)-binding domain-containing protein [Propionicimonas sp.]
MTRPPTTAATALDTSALTRALYAADASLYRVVPQAVARPLAIDDLHALVELARREHLPLTMRGAGTSCAGNAVGPGLVIDTSRHLDQVLALNADTATATVQPGVVHARLQRAATPHGLRFGPDPSTHSRCTIGGMIGNNACGPRALGYGRTADNIVALDVITGAGESLRVDSRADLRAATSPTLQGLRRLVADNLGVIRTEFGTFSRQISGYSLEHLLPERGFDVASFLAGSEGTLAVVTGAEMRLVRDVPFTLLVALGYPSMADAADDVSTLLRFRPVACEGLDRRITEVVARRFGPASVPTLPRGDGWLFLELAGDDRGEVRSRARALLAASAALEGRIVDRPDEAATLWRIRSDGAGLAAVSLDTLAHPGWEDSAVPPAHLGAYLRDLDALLTNHGLHALPYGHFGEGCVHARIDFPLDRPQGAAVLRAFLHDAAELVAGHGGSMSGEHGDGRARSELLPRMYSPAAIRLFAAVKHLFDPENLLNPGVIVDPAPLDAHLRLSAVHHSGLALAHPELTAAVHRCTGVGRCVSPEGTAADLMCPSFRATRNEPDSTRGRARALQEMLAADVITGGFRAPEVAEALELCLACKGCARDCPTGVDLAAAKSRVLDEAWRGRLRPRSHYALGQLPRWGRLVTGVPGLGALVNAALRVPGIVHLARWVAGIDQRRSLPAFAVRPLRRSLSVPTGAGRPVALWIDSFSDAFTGTHLPALLTVLLDAGFAPHLIEEPACCGLTWITTGQRDAAASHLRAAIDVLHPYAVRMPILGVEPSCLAVWRSDAADLVDDPRLAEVAAATRTLAELLRELPGYSAPDLTGHHLIVQPHCHQAAVLGWEADAALLRRTGASVTTLGGCCGLAGNFGVEAGHYDVSVAVAEDSLLPALRADPTAIVVADGFSCRKQVSDLTQRRAVTLAELLARHLPPTTTG